MCETFVRRSGSDLDLPAVVHFDTGRLDLQDVAVGAATNGDENAVERRVIGRVVALERDLDAVVAGLGRCDLRAQVDRLVALAHSLCERLHEVRVAARDELVGQLNDGDLRAKRFVNRRHLEPDDPAADDEQRVGDVRQFERAGRVDDPLVIGQIRKHHSARAGGDDRVLELDGFAGHVDRFRRDETAPRRGRR